jgi:hypothetical protein
MKTSVKSSLLILLGLALSFASMALPAAKVQYQIAVNAGQSAITSPTFIHKEGYENAMANDKYGREAIPCVNPRMESLPGTGFMSLLFVWRGIVFWLIFGPAILALDDAVRRKPPLGKFFAWTAGAGGILILATWVISTVYPEPDRPLCNFNDLYRVVSFMPNWLFIPLPVVAMLLVYVGTHRKSNNESAVAASTGSA